MTIATTIAAFQTLHASILGVARAPLKIPASLTTADLPIALTWPGEGTFEASSSGSIRRHDCAYVVTVYCEPVGQGLSSLDTATHDAIVLFQRFIEAYQNTANLTLVDDGTYQATINSSDQPIRHIGLRGDLEYGRDSEGKPQYYRGFRCFVPVMEKY